MSATRSRSGIESLGRVFEERVLGSPILEPMLVIICISTAIVLVRLPGLPGQAVPRLLLSGVLAAARMSALYVLVYVVMSRLLPRRPHRKMDKNELELRRRRNRLLDESIFNPQRPIL